MATVPTYDEWMKTTKLGVLQARSAEFEAIDAALKKFEQDRNGEALKGLHSAFNAWKRTKPDWTKSERNKEKILERLDAAIKERLGPLGAGLSREEREALRYWMEQRAAVVQRLFAGREVCFKAATTTVESKNALNTLRRGADAVSGGAATAGLKTAGAAASKLFIPSVPKAPASLGAIERALEGMIGKFFDEAASAVVKPKILSAFGGDVVASMVPVLGIFKNAADVIYAWGVTGKKLYDELTTTTHKPWIGDKGSDVKKSFESLERLLAEATKHSAINATRVTTTFAAKSALALADGGSVSGPALTAADAIAKVTHQLWRLGTEYRQTKRANEILRTPAALDFRLVGAYPLLGCYVLTCSSLSDVMNMAHMQFGEALWKEDVEWIKKHHIDPVREKARGFIDASMFHVPGLTPLVQAGTFDTLQWAKKVVVG